MAESKTADSGEAAALAVQNAEPGAYKDVALDIPVETRLGLAQRPKAPDPKPFNITGSAGGSRE